MDKLARGGAATRRLADPSALIGIDHESLHKVSRDDAHFLAVPTELRRALRGIWETYDNIQSMANRQDTQLEISETQAVEYINLCFGTRQLLTQWSSLS
jgi:hypothetical protein